MIYFSERKFKFEGLVFLSIFLFFMIWLYLPILQKPNLFLSPSGDGLKNYFTYLYHVKHDSSYWKFEGMNYPFGENIVFTDNQPILSNSVKFLSQYFPNILCNLVAIHNILLLIGLWLGGLGLFYCFRALKIDFFFALVISIGLILLNPQLNRILGHFGMFYPFLPWLFYIWLKLISNKNTNYILFSFLYSGLLIFSGLLHMYNFLCGAMLSMLFLIVYILKNVKQLKIGKLLLILSIQVVIPFLVLLFVTSYFSPVIDRPSAPLGYFYYRAYLEGFIFSYKLPLFELINENVIKIRSIDYEAKNYIGIISVLFLFFGIFYLIKNVKKYKFVLEKLSWQHILFWIFLTSFLISMAFPFILPGFKWLLDYTGPLKQFRSIARIGWISFYAINLLAFYSLYHAMKAHKNTKLMKIFYFVIPFIVLIEGVLFNLKTSTNQFENTKFSCDSKFSELPIVEGEYQAILPNPYHSAGAESLGWPDLGYVVNFGYEIGYNFALPTLGANLSRTSYHQAFLLNSLVSQPFKVPEIIQQIKIKDSRPLLVVESKLEYQDKRGALDHWVSSAEVVYENESYRLRKMPLSQFDSVVSTFVNNTSFFQSDKEQQGIKEIQLNKQISNGNYGYENHYFTENLTSGLYKFSYILDVPDAISANSITEIWQISKNDENLEYIAEANHFNYKLLDQNKMYLEFLVNLKENCNKIIFRVSTAEKRKKDNLDIHEAKFLKIN